jgi:2-polyprenyl-3-methyl-5-hydroxy-6-metoxy-1,4-benzoquinol methylase
MMDQAAIQRHLSEEMARRDPWALDANPFDVARFDAMEAMLRPVAPFGHALELGCAAGAMSERLARLSRRLHLVDCMASALERATHRIGAMQGLTCERADIGSERLAPGAFDLVVVAEVLYFIDAGALEGAIDGLVARLRPGGWLLLTSVPDAIALRWGLQNGIETCLPLFQRRLGIVQRSEVTGVSDVEHAHLVLFRAPTHASPVS